MRKFSDVRALEQLLMQLQALTKRACFGACLLLPSLLFLWRRLNQSRNTEGLLKRNEFWWDDNKGLIQKHFYTFTITIPCSIWNFLKKNSTYRTRYQIFIVSIFQSSSLLTFLIPIIFSMAQHTRWLRLLITSSNRKIRDVNDKSGL